MDADRIARLEAVLDEIGRRWGADALRPLAAAVVLPACIPTGFAALDGALPGGGIPRGRITELAGAATCGATTLALGAVAGAQASGGLAVYVDLARSFDPCYAAERGVRLERLLIARPADAVSGLDIAHAVATRSAAGLVVVDSTAEVVCAPGGGEALNAVLRRLSPALGRSGCAVIFLSLGEGRAGSLPHTAALRLRVEREGWVEQGGDVVGWRSRVAVVKSRMGGVGRQVTLTMLLSEDAA